MNKSSSYKREIKCYISKDQGYLKRTKKNKECNKHLNRLIIQRVTKEEINLNTGYSYTQGENVKENKNQRSKVHGVLMKTIEKIIVLIRPK